MVQKNKFAMASRVRSPVHKTKVPYSYGPKLSRFPT
jgi:hypothetical protein